MTAPIPERHPDRSTRTEEAMSLTDDALEQVGRLFKENAELRTELDRVRAELDARIAAESTDAAAGSYAGRAEEAEAARDAVQAEATLLRRALIGRRQFPAGVMRTPMDERTEAIRARWDEFCFSGPSETDRERDQVIGWLLDRMDNATERAERAETALAEMRERLGEPSEQWGVRTRDDDSDEDIEVVSSEAIAREFASTWRSEIPDANPTAMVRTRCEPGPWREADATPHTALERAADEQGVPLVCDVDKLTAPEHERLSDEEWTAYAGALGIETGDEQGDGEGGGA